MEFHDPITASVITYFVMVGIWWNLDNVLKPLFRQLLTAIMREG